MEGGGQGYRSPVQEMVTMQFVDRYICPSPTATSDGSERSLVVIILRDCLFKLIDYII